MTRIRYSQGFDPFDALLSLQKQLNRVFDRPFGFDLGPSGRGVYPAVNVFTDPDGYVLRMEVPGISADSLDIQTKGRTLTVSGKREESAPQGGSFHRRERSTGAFSRSLQLPEDVDTARSSATYKEGILTVRIPKREESKPRQITVQAA
jgi:HSP20 family protein